jgi:hypothetical protein
MSAARAMDSINDQHEVELYFDFDSKVEVHFASESYGTCLMGERDF